MKTLKAIALAVATAVFFPVAASAATQHAAFMRTGENVAAPSGFAEMCQRDPADCLTRAQGAAAPVVLDAAHKATLERINRKVNDLITPAEDMQVYGVKEMWVDPLAGRPQNAKGRVRGDCEDYALAKRDLLIAEGWPPGALFIAVGYHSEYGLHAVLIAHTDGGDLVLDSRTPWIEAWGDTPYVWVKRQVASNSANWVRPFESSWSQANSSAAQGATAALPVNDRRGDGEAEQP
jgi:predicted transglutaminase-like cysteine proteinase